MDSEVKHTPGPAARALSAVLIGRHKRVGDEAAMREVLKLEAINADLLKSLKALLEPYTGIGSQHLSGCDLSTIAEAFAAVRKATA